MRGSLAHELIHSIRALSNRSFWENNTEDANRHNVPRTNNGGFHVGSHAMGSEAVAELFEAAIRFDHRTGRIPTIKDIFPDIALRLQENTTADNINDKYFIARFLLFDHIKKLVDEGAGDVSAYDLVALGAYGYVSLEKAPDLIKLGLITKEKQERMLKVIIGLRDWLVSDSESGFTINS